MGKLARLVLRSRVIWGVTVGVTVFAVIFVGLLASAWWDPAARTHNVKVALVNEDAGFTVPAGPLAGQTLRTGATVAQQFTSIRSEGETLFDWQVVKSKQTAMRGLEDGDYTMAIVIPSDFSGRLAMIGAAASGQSLGSPTAATIQIIPDQSNAAFQVSMITAMGQQLVQKASAAVGAQLVQQLQAAGQAGAATGGGDAATTDDGQSGSASGSAGATSAQAGPVAQAVAAPIAAEVAPINPVDRYGKSIGLVFFMLFLAIAGVALTGVWFVTTRKLRGTSASAPGWVFGGWLGLLLPALVVGVVCTAFLQIFGFSMESTATCYGIVMLGMIAFVTLDLMLVAIFGAAGMPIAALLIPLQVAAGGAMMGPELTPGFYQALSHVFPYTYTLDGLRSGMFGGNGAGMDAVALVVIIAVCLVLALALSFLPGLVTGRKRHSADVAPTVDELTAS